MGLQFSVSPLRMVTDNTTAADGGRGVVVANVCVCPERGTDEEGNTSSFLCWHLRSDTALLPSVGVSNSHGHVGDTWRLFVEKLNLAA
jgi:hypothetical protein